jgi:cell division protease FtsH
MVTQYGMTDFGYAQLDSETLRVGGEVAVLAHRAIDGLIRDAHTRAAALLEEHRELLEALATALLDEETLDTGRIRELAAAHGAAPVAPRGLPSPRREVPAPVAGSA